jgi:hypothetical protein
VARAATVWGLMQGRDRFEIALCVGYSTVCLVSLSDGCLLYDFRSLLCSNELFYVF